MQKLPVREQVVKTVVKSGNGGAVWVPKGWLGQEVIVTLPEKPEFELREKIIHLLEPHLKSIVSVGIYGSYARNEQTKGSDVDVLVITKDKNLRLSFKGEKIDAVSFPIDKFKIAIKKYPAIYYQIVLEAEPLINAYAIAELRSIKIKKEDFRDYLKEAREHLKSNKELLELDKLDNSCLESYSVLYSAMLRMRGLFIIRCILNKGRFSNKKFKGWLTSQGLDSGEFEESYNAYRMVRDDKSTKNLEIGINVAEKVLNILEKELNLLESKIYGK
ncbi:nucleotidyltransferase domain-containing protein [Candidatus Woesearchaeota archaeon]|nr:nucleotidyltransferase domain-containing protein [Candidatus Woesearchaeota archaeon]